MDTISIQQLRLEFDKNFSRIPKFITTTDHMHFIIWQGMLGANSIIMRLVNNRILTERQIARIINDFATGLDFLLEHTRADLQLHISAYYCVIIEKMIMRSGEEEHYEVCSNLKKFYDYYFNNNIVDSDD
jgi:hypothetical protein